MCVHALLGPQRDTEVPKGQACATDMPDISHGCMLSCFSCIRLFETLWTVVCQAPLSMGFSRQEYWSGLPFPSPGDLPSPGIKPGSLHCSQILYHLSHQGLSFLNCKTETIAHVLHTAALNLYKTMLVESDNRGHVTYKTLNKQFISCRNNAYVTQYYSGKDFMNSN